MDNMDIRETEEYTPCKADKAFSVLIKILLLSPILLFILKYVISFILAIIIANYIRADDLPREIDRAESGNYTVILEATDDPFFFSSQNGRLILQKNGKTISHTNFILSNDGGGMSSNNWEVSWMNDGAIVTIKGCEQKDETFLLYFNEKMT